jgi:ADP-sugar diphosphatase
LKVFAYIHKLERGMLEDWKGRLMGRRDHGEKITLKVVKLKDLWKETLDAKALAAVALWEGLNREGKV